MDVSELQTILALDWKYGLVFVAAVIIIAVWIIQKFDFLVSKFGFTTERMRKDEQKEKDISELKKHADRTDEKIDKIFDSMDEMKESVNALSEQVRKLSDRNDMNEAARLKDRIAQGYRYFSERGEWTSMDKESMEALIQAYSQYSENSFVHSVVEKELYQWKIIDE